MLMPRAYRDLDDIYAYVADSCSSPMAADALIGELEQAILSLDFFPERGSKRHRETFSNYAYRQIFVKNFTIVYRIDKDQQQVLIVTVRHKRRR
jgi:plasmid stabilization system protein ParE